MRNKFQKLNEHEPFKFYNGTSQSATLHKLNTTNAHIYPYTMIQLLLLKCKSCVVADVANFMRD